MTSEAHFSIEVDNWRKQLQRILTEFQEIAQLHSKHLFVVGCSTSEVIGKRIGTEGTLEVAEMIYHELAAFATQTGIQLAFQCCEHLNRALVLPREVAEERGYDEVSVIPAKSRWLDGYVRLSTNEGPCRRRTYSSRSRYRYWRYLYRHACKACRGSDSNID